MNQNIKSHLIGVMTIPIVCLLCYLVSNQPDQLSISYADVDDRPTGGRELGKWLFRRNCSTCHGQDGIGGISNPNYIKDTYPQLNTLAQKIGILDQDDASAIIKLLETGKDLSIVNFDVARKNVIIAQFIAYRNVVRNGSKPGKKSIDGPDPIAMPAWGSILKDDEIYAIFAYLMSLQNWDDQSVFNNR